MLKKFVSLSLIYAILLVTCFSAGISAQTQTGAFKTDTAKTDVVKTETLKTEPVLPKTEVRKVFSKELQIAKSDTAVSESEIDFKKLEKIEMRKSAKAKMAKKEKTLWVLFFVALGVGVILLSIYGKLPKCSQVSCDPDYDEDCYCDNGE